MVRQNIRKSSAYRTINISFSPVFFAVRYPFAGCLHLVHKGLYCHWLSIQWSNSFSTILANSGDRSVENAIARSYQLLQIANLHYVIEFDIKGFFDNVDHSKLIRQIWAMGIHDKHLIYVLRKMLTAPIRLENGVQIVPDKGTPQGGIISQLVASRNRIFHRAIRTESIAVTAELRYGMQDVLDELYAQSKNGKVFEDLMPKILSRENILLAYRNIKANKGITLLSGESVPFGHTRNPYTIE